MAQESLTESREVEFWFDFASTYSYPASMRVEDVADRYRCAVRWRPFLLGPIFKEQGWPDSPFNLYPVKGRYMWRDLERLCSTCKIPFQRPSTFPRRSLLATRVAWAIQTSSLPQFARRVFAANFVEDQDIADPQVILRCLGGLTQEPESVLAAASAPEAKSRVRQNTQRAMELGIFGAPTFIAEGELFWGNDRLETAFEWSRSRGARFEPVG